MSDTDRRMAPGWYPDPGGRHEHRFWDGTRWTEQVADQGTSGTDSLVPAPPAADVGPDRRSPLLAIVLAVVALVVLGVAAFVLLGDDGDDGGGGTGSGGGEPRGGSLVGSYEVEGTNADGSSYQGTAEITGSGPDYRIEWTTGSSTSSGRGTLEGDRFEASFSGSLTGTGTAVYRVEDDGRLVGTWTVEGSTAEGTETLTPT